MAAAHEGYARRRWSLLSVEDRSIAEDRNWAGMLRDEVGVAGLEWKRHGVERVKCLHAHYAHFLGTHGGSSDSDDDDDEDEEEEKERNLVGLWVHELLLQRGVI